MNIRNLDRYLYLFLVFKRLQTNCYTIVCMYRYYWKNSHIFGISEIWRDGFLLSVIQNITCPNNTVEWNVINSKVIWVWKSKQDGMTRRGKYTNDDIYVIMKRSFFALSIFFCVAVVLAIYLLSSPHTIFDNTV